MDSEQIMNRFNQERKILARLQHENIARLFDAGLTDDGRPYFSMEYIDGLTITEYCDTNKLTINERLKLFQAVCQTVSYAHRNLVIHRDLKPNNIHVTASGKVMLLDFGIAKVLEDDELDTRTREGQFVMTPEYAAPEQFENRSPSVSSDIYQLGVVLFEILNGQRPYQFESISLHEIHHKLLHSNPESLDRISSPGIAQNRKMSIASLRKILKSDLNDICQKAFRREANNRYPSVESFNDDIQRFLDSRPVRARKGTLIYNSRKFIKRYRPGIVTILILIITTFSLIGFYTKKLSIERDKATSEAQKTLQVSSFLINLFELSDPEVAQGHTITARELLDKSSQDIPSKLNGQPLLQAQMYDVLGQVYSKLALFDTAEVVLKKALDLRRKYAFGSDDHALSQKNLATVYLETGAYDTAAQLLDSAQSILAANSDHPTLELANVFNIKGRMGHYTRNFADAENYFLKALQIDSSLLGMNTERVASDLNDLALATKRLGNYDKSEILQRKALKIKTNIYGEDSYELSTEYFSLAKLLHLRDDFEQADSLFAKALKIDRVVLGESHSDLAKVLTAYSFLKKDMHELDDATEFIDEAYNINLHLFGKHHPSVASNLDFKARLLRYAGKYDQSIALHKEALVMKQSIWGESHPSVANTINNLGRAYDAKGDLKKAERCYRQAMEMVYEIQGKDDPEAATMLHNLAMCVYNQKEYPRALPLIKESLAAQQRLHHEKHRRVLGEKDNLAFVYIDLDSLTKAENLFRQVLQVQKKNNEPGHRYIGRSLDNLGYVLFLQNKLSESEKALTESYSILSAASANEDHYTRKVLQHLVDLYERLNLPEKKEAFQELLTN